ncbi:hypothetical protein Q9966_003540 [Columba livia]|nr:hypothetical protein Q9966_003540 [Columba livia]
MSSAKMERWINSDRLVLWASVRNLYQQQARLKYQLWQTVHDVDAFELFPIDEA